MTRSDRLLESVLRKARTAGMSWSELDEIERRLAAKRAERQRKAAKSAPRRAEKRAKRLERNEGTARLRGELLGLTGGVCERCGFMPVPEQGHMHHTEPGGGRVQRQHIGNVAWLCSACHGVVHAHPVENKGLRAAIAAKREARR